MSPMHQIVGKTILVEEKDGEFFSKHASKQEKWEIFQYVWNFFG